MNSFVAAWHSVTDTRLCFLHSPSCEKAHIRNTCYIVKGGSESWCLKHTWTSRTWTAPKALRKGLFSSCACCAPCLAGASAIACTGLTEVDVENRNATSAT